MMSLIDQLLVVSISLPYLFLLPTIPPSVPLHLP